MTASQPIKEAAMAEKQQPQFDIVKRAAQILKDPRTATIEDARRMAARILDDERNDPQLNRVDPKPSGRR
jgi:hypothetical protein